MGEDGGPLDLESNDEVWVGDQL